tara:strand:- start:663 stop:1901 length:1239 start_codon:yes stop_codon:yes gene_type:complete
MLFKKNMNWTNFLKNISLLFLSLIIALLLAEGLARLFLDDAHNSEATDNIYKFFEFDSKLGWKNKSNYSGIFKREEYEYRISINSEGMRHKEVSKEKSKNKQRIAVMGDSFTWGVGVKDSERFTNIVENKSTENYDVLNFGVSGYGPLRYFLQLDKVLEFNPDIVFLTFCLGNDFADNVFFNRYGYYGPFTVLDNKPELEIYGYPLPEVGEFYNFTDTYIPLLSSFIEGSRLYYLSNLFYRNLNTERLKVSIYNSESPFYLYKNQRNFSQAGHLGAKESQRDVYVPNHSNEAKLFAQDMAAVNKKILSKINDRLKAKNINFAVIVAPTKCDYGQCFQDFPQDMDGTMNNNARNLLIDDLNDLGIDYIDPSDSISLDDFYTIDSHWLASGHKTIANHVLKWLSNNTVIKKKNK